MSFKANNEDDNRFSVVILERDVSEYMNYRSKYYFYNNKLKKGLLIRRGKYKKQEKYYYNLYINKMNYLEENYCRKNKNIPDVDITNSDGDDVNDFFNDKRPIIFG